MKLGLWIDQLLFVWAANSIRRHAERLGCDAVPVFTRLSPREDLRFVYHSDGVDVYAASGKCCHRLSESELRSYGWVGDVQGSVTQLLDDFNGHVRRVDAATKLTQHQEDSQLKRAKKVSEALASAFSLLGEYQWANVRGANS